MENIFPKFHYFEYIFLLAASANKNFHFAYVPLPPTHTPPPKKYIRLLKFFTGILFPRFA